MPRFSPRTETWFHEVTQLMDSIIIIQSHAEAQRAILTLPKCWMSKFLRTSPPGRLWHSAVIQQVLIFKCIRNHVLFFQNKLIRCQKRRILRSFSLLRSNFVIPGIWLRSEKFCIFDSPGKHGLDIKKFLISPSFLKNVFYLQNDFILYLCLPLCL